MEADDDSYRQSILAGEHTNGTAGCLDSADVDWGGDDVVSLDSSSDESEGAIPTDVRSDTSADHDLDPAETDMAHATTRSFDGQLSVLEERGQGEENLCRTREAPKRAACMWERTGLWE